MTKTTTTVAEDKSFLSAFTQAMLGSLDAAFALDWVRENFEPADIFEESDLEAWAEEHGWVKEK